MNPGSNKLAIILSKRIKKESDSPQILDFGSIQADYSLMADTFPIAIPQKDYTICRQLAAEKNGGSLKVIQPGDRVLVVWVQNEAVVIDRILPAASI